MNRVINAQRYGRGWRVGTVTPSGEDAVVFVCGSLHWNEEVGEVC